MKRITAVLIAIATLAACSGDSTKDQQNNGWQLGDDAGNNASDASQTNAANNVMTSNNTTSTPNNVTSNTTTTMTTNNTTASTNGTSNNTTASTNNMTMGNGTAGAGDDCSLNSDCGSNLTCCQGRNGSTCESRCFSGGLCGGNDAECATDEQCCDLSGINQPDACARRCPGGGNNMGMACQNNTECTGTDEVCCLGFDGSGQCTTQCFTGGACATDADCNNGQLCCDFSVAKVCLDQCNF